MQHFSTQTKPLFDPNSWCVASKRQVLLATKYYFAQKISRSSPPYLAPFLFGADCLLDLVLAFVFLFLLHICLLQYLRPSLHFWGYTWPISSMLYQDHLKWGILATWQKYISIVVYPQKKASICLNTLPFSSKKIFVAQGQQNNTFLL